MSLTVSQAGVNHQPGHQGLTPAQRLASVNEETWLQIGKVAELMSDLDRAMAAYESALRQNPYSIPAMNQIASILRAREQFPRAVEYFQSILNLDQNNGETWGSLGHCYLMMDDLQKAYSAYQQALYHLQNPKEPKLWYGIGILYDRYGSLEHAEEAFSQVMRMDASFDKANEIYFRLGIIYKQQHKYSQSLECFNYIMTNPPKPLTEVDIWFQIGHVYEQQKEYSKAKEAYERVLRENPDHAKVLQQLGWLYHQQSTEFSDQDSAVQFLTKSLESDGADAQSWYLLGRCYMAQRKYNKAYEAYQQAVYRDGRNPTFWCSIGVLYYQINQYRDALDAYSRAIRLNPYISEVWYDLGTLYESCNNQVNDALDAYGRAATLDPSNPHIKARLELLRVGQAPGAQPNQGGAPHPQDINPHAYQNALQGLPQQWNGQQTQNVHPQQQQQQLPPPPPHQQQQQQQQQQLQQQQQRQGPPTPSQTPYRPPENQIMRPPQSPDRSKLTNGSRGPFSKQEGNPQGAHHHQVPVVHHQTQNPPPQPYQPQHNQLPSMGQAPPATLAPVEGGSLAPILGRTSPVTEIKPLASRDDENVPREQPPMPTHQPSHQLNHQPSQPPVHQPAPVDRMLSPQVTRDSAETVSLKRSREWENEPQPPEAKKQETQAMRNSDRVDRDSRLPDEETRDAVEPHQAAPEEPAQVANGSGSEGEEGVTKEGGITASALDNQSASSSHHSPSRKETASVAEAAERKVQLDENYDEED